MSNFGLTHSLRILEQVSDRRVVPDVVVAQLSLSA
jgi:hypothetical protein